MKGSKGKKPISLISGVVAGAQGGRRRKEEEDIERAHRFRVSLNAALLKARTRIRSNEISSFFANARRIASFATNRFSRYEPGYSYLSILIEAPTRPLTFELKWLAHRLADAKVELASFVAMKSSLENCATNGKYSEALVVLDSIDKLHGTSLWSTALRIALLQQIGGDSAQREFLNNLRRIHKSAILPFYARYISQRAENAVPIGWYLENARRRISQHAHGDINTYFHFRVTGDMPTRHQDLATILRIEQNHHIFDIYETYLTVLQHLTTQNRSSTIGSAVSNCVSIIAEIPDFRINKLALVHGHPVVKLEIACHRASDWLLSLDAVRAQRHARRSSDRSGPSLYSTVIQAIALSARKAKRAHARGSNVGHIIASTLAIYAASNRQLGIEEAPDYAKKFGFVFEGLPYAMATRHLSGAIESNDVAVHYRALKLATLNAPEISFLDVIAYSDTPAISAEILKKLPKGPSTEFAYLFTSGHTTPISEALSSHESYARSCAFHHAGNFDQVEASIGPALKASSRLISALAAVVALSAYGANGNISEASDLISREVSKQARSPDSLPTASVFKGLAWRDLAPFADSISVSNALAAYAEVETSDELLTIRNFALRKALMRLAIDRPSEIAQIESAVNDETIYFLANACTTDVLDMLPSLPSSRSVKEERRDICAYLIKANPARAADYKYDVLTLTKEIAISQGLQTIDASRVHVDIAALRSILRRDLADSFQRYLSLTKASTESPESFDSILRELTKAEFSAKHLLSMPESDADDLLITMIRQARERFLFNVPHGLDSYLSKRVRHGSIVGFLRAPVEAEGMITQQHSDGRYKDNTRWGLVIAQSNEPVELQKAFLAFSRSFDQHLLRLKDVLLHVRSEDKPLGLFDAALSAPHYRLIRSIAIDDRTLDGFVDTMLATLRGLINPSLKAASDQLARDTSKYVGDLFNNLRGAVMNYMQPGQDRTNLLAALNRSSAAAQGSITNVSQWFTPIEMEDYKFDMEMVCGIAATSVSKIVNGFNPNIRFLDESGLTISVKQLPFFQDILFIILGNAAKWSNMPCPDIDLTISYNPEDSLIKFRSINDIKPDRPLVELKKRVVSLHARLKEPEFMELARKDESSGIAKLASIAFQSEHGTVDFGFDDEERFFVEAALSIQTDR